jgi:hypothetical protein
MSQIMSREAANEDEFYNKATGMLQSLGVRNVKVGQSGSIPVRSQGSFQIESLDIYETTRGGQKALNQFPRAPSDRILSPQYDRPICGIVGCGITQFLGLECSATSEEYIDPKIEFRNNPTAVTSATAYLNPVNARIEGDVEVTGDNFSEPGEVKTTTTYKCKDDVETSTEVVDGSAVLSMESSQTFGVESIDETIDTVQSSIADVTPDTSESVNVGFRKEGFLELIESVIDVWVTGSMLANVTGEVDIQYEWNGSTKNRTFNIDSEVRIPIQDLNYSW